MRFTSTGDELTGRQMTEQWYEEAANYNYNEDFQQGKGHFAQLVWSGTREVGFGRARAADGKWYAVANYYPAGNYIGQFKQNVKPPKHNHQSSDNSKTAKKESKSCCSKKEKAKKEKKPKKAKK